MDFIDHRSTANFIFSLSATDEKFRITNNGDVGIGTSSPSTKLEVNGVITTAGLTTTADINFGDNDKAIFGAGSDLQIYHDGSNSYVQDAGTGNLFLQGTELQLRANNSMRYLTAVQAAEVKLYYNNSQKLATTSTGIDVTGTAVTDGLTVDGVANLNSAVNISSTSPALFFMESDTTDLNTRLRSNGGKFQIHTVDDSKAAVGLRFDINNSTGDISFYEDTGTTAKFFWDASAESLGINDTSPARKLSVNSGGVQIAAKFESSSTTSARIGLVDGNTTADNYVNVAAVGDAMALYAGAAERFRITSGGNVGIGTTSPLNSLHIQDSVSQKLLLTNDDFVNGTTGTSFDITFGATSGNTYSEIRHLNNGRSSWSNFVLARGGGNVGIGTSSPATPLHINTNVQAVAQLESTHANGSYAIWAVGGTKFGDVGSKKGISGTGNTTDFMVASRSTYPLVLGTGSTERMRIDSSGNLLVGKSSSSFTTAGVELAQGGTAGKVQIQRSSSPLTLVNLTDDGNILNFYKGTTAVGSIASVGGNRIAIGTDDVGLFFDSVGDELEPWSITAGSVRDAAIDIGRSGGRFKDLYLSGTVNAAQVNLADAGGNLRNVLDLDGSDNLKVGTGSSAGTRAITFFTENTEQMRLDASGNVGIGTASPEAKVDIVDTAADVQLRVYKFDGTNNTRLTLTADDSGAKIHYRDATNGGALRFNNNAGEMARFDASSNFLIHKTVTAASTAGAVFVPNNYLSVANTQTGATARLLLLNRQSGTGTAVEFRQANAGVGSISLTASATAYNTSSDQRLKDNIVDAPSASDDIDAIQVRSFDWKADGSHQKYGMVAQELQSVAPEAVSGDADSDDMMGVDYSKLVPMMLKEIQSLRARVAQLEGEN
jgi:hypothetical protein